MGKLDNENSHYRTAQLAFESSNLTPQEAADLADLHVNTVKKILKNEYVHTNSVTKLIRAIADRQKGSDTVVSFHTKNPAQKSDTLSSSISNVATLLDEFIADAKQDPKKILKFNTEELWIDISRIEGSLRTIDSAQRRHKKKKRR